MSRRRRTGFATPLPPPPLLGGAVLPKGGRTPLRPAGIQRYMDASGARVLAARIAAGVRIGSRIELIADSEADLRAGDRGVVREIESGGDVVIEWERGFHSSINPRNTAFRALAL
jgi:hypothetical protein